jgi:hypothetical protein
LTSNGFATTKRSGISLTRTVTLRAKDEDIKKIDDQKLNDEGSEREKDNFVLIVEKGCNFKN